LRDSRREIANMTPRIPSYAAGFGTVSRCEPISSRGRAILAGIQPVEISRGVNGHGHSQGTHPVFDLLMTGAHRGERNVRQMRAGLQ